MSIYNHRMNTTKLFDRQAGERQRTDYIPTCVAYCHLIILWPSDKLYSSSFGLHVLRKSPDFHCFYNSASPAFAHHRPYEFVLIIKTLTHEVVYTTSIYNPQHSLSSQATIYTYTHIAQLLYVQALLNYIETSPHS